MVLTMTLLDLAQQHVTLRKVGSEWHGACPACGAGKSGLDKTDRFSVKPDDRFFCRTCTPSGGDAIEFLKKFEGKSCPEAHAVLGLECQSTTCPVLDKCSKGHGKARKRDDRQRQTPQPKADGPTWAPAAATEPVKLWRANAAVLVEWAHKRLLQDAEQLAWLAARGLPIDAVRKYTLGWWPETKFRPLGEWGLPEEKNPATARPRKLWIPRGLIIPTLRDGQVDRIRIRRHADDLGDGRGKYVALKGSSDDVPVYGAGRRAFVVVESDLDGLLVDWLAGDLVGAIPLASCSVKPRSRAAQVLQPALAILVAHDFEPRQNETTGKYENPGGHGALWWKRTFRQSRRWPVPAGKDPGEYFQDHGGDIRAWILQGLPPGLRILSARPADAPVPPVTDSPAAPEVDRGADPNDSASAFSGTTWTFRRRCGHTFHVAEFAVDAALLAQLHPEEAVFTAAEIQTIKAEGLTPEETEPILLARQVFGFCGAPLQIKPVVGEGRVSNVVKFDPSRQRAARR